MFDKPYKTRAATQLSKSLLIVTALYVHMSGDECMLGYTLLLFYSKFLPGSTTFAILYCDCFKSDVRGSKTLQDST